MSRKSRDATYGRRGGGWVDEGYRPGQAAEELAEMRAQREADEERRRVEAEQRGEQGQMFRAERAWSRSRSTCAT